MPRVKSARMSLMKKGNRFHSDQSGDPFNLKLKKQDDGGGK